MCVLIRYLGFLGFFYCLVQYNPAVLSVLYACGLYFCICPCSAQLSMFHVERRSRNTLIIIIIITSNVHGKKTKERKKEGRTYLNGNYVLC